MKCGTGKRFAIVWALLLCAAMFVMLGLGSICRMDAFAETTEEKTLYYVDCGNLVDSNGNKVTVWGTYGVPSKVTQESETRKPFLILQMWKTGC